EFPEAEFYSGAKRLRPLFFEGIEDPCKSSYRSFQSLADLAQAKELLDQIDAMSSTFWQMLGISAAEFVADPSVTLNVPRKELRFSQIFNTAVVHDLMTGVFAPSAPLSTGLTEFLKGEGEPDSNRLTERLTSAAERRIEVALDDPARRALMRRLAKRWITACAQELIPLVGEQLDPWFIRTVVLQLN